MMTPTLPVRAPLLLLLALGGLALASGPLAATEPAGAVVDLSGSATAHRPPTEQALSVRDPVFLADTLSTAPASRLDLKLGADLTLQLGAASTLVLADFSDEIGVTLEAGAVFVDKAPESSARPLTIDSRFGQVSVRGTRVFVGPSREPFAVFVERGHVTVTGGGSTVTLAAGEGTSIAAPGAAPTPPARWGQPRIDAALAPFR
ncbi:FecR domain-containing protein [Segnochrobactraceae bacterium EtOH-i3]